MPSSSRTNYLDDRARRIATWSAPFVVQLTIGALLITMWLLGKWPFNTHSAWAGERTWMLTSTVVTAVTSLLLTAVLLRSPSPRNRGLALSTAASCAIVLIGGTVYAYLVLR